MTKPTGPELLYQTATYDVRDLGLTMTAVLSGRRRTIAPRTVEINTYPSGRITVLARGQVIRADGTRSSTSRAIDYHVAGPRHTWCDELQIGDAPAWLKTLVDQAHPNTDGAPS